MTWRQTLAEAQDAAQEAQVRAWQRWDKISGYEDPAAWVRTVGHRLLINRWRKIRNGVVAYRPSHPCSTRPPPRRPAMPDPLFSDLIRDTGRLTWQPAEEVRELGRRRTRRIRLATGLAAFVAVAAVAGGAVALNGRPDASRPPILPATESPTPSSAPVLRAADLPSGFRAYGRDLDGDWSLEAVAASCREPGPAITPGEVARRGAVFRTSRGPDGVSIIQRVTRHSGSNAAAAMGRTRSGHGLPADPGRQHPH